VTAPVRILRIAAGGDGVGRLADGRTVFIPRSAPGDLIDPEAVQLHARFARARIGKVLEPGTGRAEPRCRHYTRDECGGCQLQHLSDESQRAARRAIVGDALRRLAKLDLPDPPLEPSLSPWAYRAKVTLAVAPTGRTAGFHPLDQADGIFDLERCEIAEPALNRLWQRTREASAAWPPALDQIILRLGRDGTAHVVFKGPVKPSLESLEAVAAGPSVRVWWQPPAGEPRLVNPGRGVREEDAVPATVFEQVNPAMGDLVRAHAIRELGPLEGRHAWDLYAGIGEATARLAESGATVESVELDPTAVALAERKGPGRGVRRHVGKVEDWIARLAPPARILANPPRSGMDSDVVRALGAVRSETIVYVSCDPATLARDLVRLGGGYRVGSVRAFDLFPQTAHVETVVRLDRA
jgi:23S rRNA (uracil1939-C5)-methyltransferase